MYGDTTSCNSPGRGGEGVLPIHVLMGICRWMGCHFHDLDGILYRVPDRVSRIGSQIVDFGGKKNLASGI